MHTIVPLHIGGAYAYMYGHHWVADAARVTLVAFLFSTKMTEKEKLHIYGPDKPATMRFKVVIKNTFSCRLFWNIFLFWKIAEILVGTKGRCHR